MADPQQYSDLPPGAKIVAAPPQYSDLPAGAKIAQTSPATGQNFNQTKAPVAPQPGMLEPHGGPGDLLRGAGAGIKQLVTNPRDALFGMPNMGTMPGAAFGPSGEQATKAQIQGVQENGQNIRNQMADVKAHPYFAAGSVIGPALATAGIAKGFEAVPKIGEYLRPTPSPDVVPPSEMAARRLSQSVLPADKDASNFIKAAPLEVPNILQHAKETNNPLKTQLEFSKAAQGHAKNVRDFYENQILKPNDVPLKTTGTGFGERTGEGPDTFAHASQIDKRIANINKQLDQPTLNADDARRALATKTELQAEAQRLREILHAHLADRTGLTPEQIADVRQRVGRSSELGNDTEAAVTKRMQGEGKGDQKPLELGQLAHKAVQFVQGGPTAIADRAFQRSIRNFPGEAQPLPSIRPPEPAPAPAPRPSLAEQAGIKVEPRPLAIDVQNPEPQLKRFAENRDTQRQGIAQSQGAKSSAELQAKSRLENLLAQARESQQQARTALNSRRNK